MPSEEVRLQHQHCHLFIMHLSCDVSFVYCELILAIKFVLSKKSVDLVDL